MKLKYLKIHNDPKQSIKKIKSEMRFKLDNGSTYGSASNIQLQKLEKFQNKCICLII